MIIAPLAFGPTHDAKSRVIAACHLYLVGSMVSPCSDGVKNKFAHDVTEAAIDLFAALGIPADDSRLGPLLDELAARPDDSIAIVERFLQKRKKPRR